MKKLLKSLCFGAVILFAPNISHALTGPFVQITTGTLQPGTTQGFYTSAGRTQNLVVDSTFTFNGSTGTIGVASGSTTINGITNITGETRYNGVVSSSGMVPISHGLAGAAIYQWQGIVKPALQFTSSVSSSTTRSTYIATHITQAITPTTTGSVIEVCFSGNVRVDAQSTTDAIVTIFRGTATNLAGGVAGFTTFGGGTAAVGYVPISFCYNDSPATTSSVSYTINLRNTDNTTQVYIGSPTTAQSVLRVRDYPQ